MANLLRDPIFIIACNRTGSTLLFQNLAQHPGVWSAYDETQHVYHGHYPIDLYEGERVGEAPTPETARTIEKELYRLAHNKEPLKDTPLLRHLPRQAFQRPVRPLYRQAPIRFLDKTPANSLRLPLLAAIFPGAKFLFLVRRGEDVVSSMIESWTRRSRVTPWRYQRWHYLVPPGWVDMITRPLPEICAFQFERAVTIAREDFARLGLDYLLVRHEDLVANPREGYQRVLDYCDLPRSDYLLEKVVADSRRVFTTGGSAPEVNKWMRLHAAEIASVRTVIDPVNALYYEAASVKAGS